MTAQHNFFIQSKSDLLNSIDTIIYHGNCIDGFASAWVVSKIYPKAKYISATHGSLVSNKILNLKDKKILFLDFSYSKEVMDKLIANNQISILDHHITAFDNLKDALSEDQITGIIRSDKSGASLTWDYFHKNKPMPDLIRYIEDIDIWKLEFSETKPVCLALNNFKFDFKVWDELMEDCEVLKEQGKTLISFVNSIQKEILKHSHKLIIDEFTVPAVNAPSAFTSELGNQLAQNKPFAAVYFSKPDGYKISLRSTEKGENVAKIAQRFGGGGHPMASSFNVPFSEFGGKRIYIQQKVKK